MAIFVFRRHGLNLRHKKLFKITAHLYCKSDCPGQVTSDGWKDGQTDHHRVPAERNPKKELYMYVHKLDMNLVVLYYSIGRGIKFCLVHEETHTNDIFSPIDFITY